MSELTPQSRVEQLLDVLLNGGEAPVPQSRIEAYLTALIKKSGSGGGGGSASIPEFDMVALGIPDITYLTEGVEIDEDTYNRVKVAINSGLLKLSFVANSLQITGYYTGCVERLGEEIEHLFIPIATAGNTMGWSGIILTNTTGEYMMQWLQNE